MVFGKASGFAASLDLATLDGSNGFRLDGIDAFDNSGRSVSGAVDVNGDVFDDIIIGARGADAGGTHLRLRPGPPSGSSVTRPSPYGRAPCTECRAR